MAEQKTLNEVLRELDRRGIRYVRIASGYHIPGVNPVFRYLLCKCEGNGQLVQIKCGCGTEVIVCCSCLDRGQVFACPKCTSEVNRNRRAAERVFGMPWKQIEEEVKSCKRGWRLR